MVGRVSVSEGHATIDFRTLDGIPNLSTSGVATEFILEVRGTVFAIEEIDSFDASLRGDCEAFWEAIESFCHTAQRSTWQELLADAGQPQHS